MEHELTGEQLISRLSTSNNPVEIKELYRQWATRYDSDLEERGYLAPTLAADEFDDLLMQHGVAQSAKIYDAGCGTGQVGVLLRNKGYQRIDGGDFSDDMLKVAALCGAYQSLEPVDYSAPIALKTNSYDAVISVGVYTHHFQQQFIPEMCRILKPGGLLYFTCRPYYFELHAANELRDALLAETIHSLRISRKAYIRSEQSEAFYISAIIDG